MGYLEIDPAQSARCSRTLFSSSLVTIGTFRAAPDHPRFAMAGQPNRHLIVFPCSSVWIQHRGDDSFVADPSVVTLYNAGDVYRRTAIAESGDCSIWFGLSSILMSELASSTPSLVIDRTEQRFLVQSLPTSVRTFLAHQAVLSLARDFSDSDSNLRVEEAAFSLLASVLQGGVVERSKSPRSEIEARHRKLAMKARELLACTYAESRSLAQLAEELDISPFHLARTFRRVTGQSLHQHRVGLRLRHALLELAQGRESLTDLALSLGFSSHAHFSSVFKREIGVQPSSVHK